MLRRWAHQGRASADSDGAVCATWPNETSGGELPLEDCVKAPCEEDGPPWGLRTQAGSRAHMQKQRHPSVPCQVVGCRRDTGNWRRTTFGGDSRSIRPRRSHYLDDHSKDSNAERLPEDERHTESAEAQWRRGAEVRRRPMCWMTCRRVDLRQPLHTATPLHKDTIRPMSERPMRFLSVLAALPDLFGIDTAIYGALRAAVCTCRSMPCPRPSVRLVRSVSTTAPCLSVRGRAHKGDISFQS